MDVANLEVVVEDRSGRGGKKTGESNKSKDKHGMSVHGWGVLKNKVHTLSSAKKRNGTQYQDFKKAQAFHLSVLKLMQRTKKQSDPDLRLSFAEDDFEIRKMASQGSRKVAK